MEKYQKLIASLNIKLEEITNNIELVISQNQKIQESRNKINIILSKIEDKNS